MGDTWLQTAQSNQLPPPGDWTVWLPLAGRGFGKSRRGGVGSLYVDLGTNTILNQTLFGVVGININQKTTANIVRAGLNYKFDWFLPPVVARY